MSLKGNVPRCYIFGTAEVVEITAFYVPFVYNLLITIAIPLAVEGTVFTASFLPIADLNPVFK